MRASSPPVRRLSASCLQEELCALGHQLHIDPRYRDTRPIARSASNLYLGNDQGGYYHPPPMAPCVTHFSPMRPLRKTPPPSIYIEEYHDEPAKDSQESFGNFAAYSDAHQPLNEEGIASMALSDEIPFIDDEEEEKQHQQRPCMSTSSCSSTVKRNPAAGYRKTVSFDLEQGDGEPGAIGIDRKYHTHDAISHFAASASSTESLMADKDERIPLIQKIRRELNSKRATNCSADGFSSGGSGSNSQRSSSESIERMPLLRQNHSPCQRQLNTQRSHKRSGVGTAAPIVSIQVPSVCEIESSSTRSPTVNTSNRYCASTTFQTKTIPGTTMKANSRRASSQVNLNPRFLLPLGQGKVREMAEYFNANKNFPPIINKSRSTSALDDPGSNPCAKLSQAEQSRILKQLKEWSLHGSAGKDFDEAEKVGDKISCECPCCAHCRGKREQHQGKQEQHQVAATFKCYDSCRDVEAEPTKQKPELSRYTSYRQSVMCSNRQAHSVRQLKRNKQQKHVQLRTKPSSHSRHHHHHHCHKQQRPRAPATPPSTDNTKSNSSDTKRSSASMRNPQSCSNCGDAIDDCHSCSCSEVESCSSAGESSSSCCAAHCEVLETCGHSRRGDNDSNAGGGIDGNHGGGGHCVKMSLPVSTETTSTTVFPTHR